MEKRLKVLIFHNILWSHYKGAVFSKLAKIAKGTQVDVRFVQIARTSKERLGLGGVDMRFHSYEYELLFDSSFHSIGTMRMAVALIRSVRANRPDAVLLPGYERLAYWALWTYCWMTKVELLISVDSTRFDHPRVWYKESVKRVFVSKCIAGFCYGTRSREYLEFLGMSSERITVRCQAAPVEQMQSPAAADLMQTYNSDIAQLLYVGRLAEEKGLRALLSALKSMRTEDQSVALTIVGDGPLRKELEELADSLAIADIVHFAGARKVTELGIFYSRAFALVLPSTSEPWGLVVNEAFGFGCPAVVSSACGCAPDLIFPATGFVYEAGNEEALRDALTLMINSKPRRTEMGKACKDLISEFTPDHAATQILGGIMRFAGRHGRVRESGV